MNTLDIKFYFLAISSLVFAYHANASESHLPQNLNEQLKKAFSVADAKTHGSFVIAGTFLANNPSVCAPDNIALKSALETAGYALGACKADLSKLDYRETGEHFVTNYLIREAGVALSARGYSTDSIVNACNQLPAGVKDAVTPMVTKGVQVVTHPETLTIATMYILNNVVIPYLENKKS